MQRAKILQVVAADGDVHRPAHLSARGKDRLQRGRHLSAGDVCAQNRHRPCNDEWQQPEKMTVDDHQRFPASFMLIASIPSFSECLLPSTEYTSNL